jgi:hypothetical protein
MNMEQKSSLEKSYAETKKIYETLPQFKEEDHNIKNLSSYNTKVPYKLKNSSVDVLVTCINEEMHLGLDKSNLSFSTNKYIKELFKEQKIKNKGIECEILKFQKEEVDFKLSDKQPPKAYGMYCQKHVKNFDDETKWIDCKRK